MFCPMFYLDKLVYCYEAGSPTKFLHFQVCIGSSSPDTLANVKKLRAYSPGFIKRTAKLVMGLCWEKSM